MKLLEEFQDLPEAETIANKLEAKGILTFISFKKPLKSLGIKILPAPYKHGLWIVLNHQYSDAILYLKNENHVVTTTMSPEEIKHLKEHSKITTFKAFNTFIVYASITIILILVGVYFAIE